MVKFNDIYVLQGTNSFKNVSEKVKAFKKEYPNKKIISLGIGDVSKPIVKPVVDAMHKAINDLADIKTFKGYGFYYGHDFLKQAILDNEYKDKSFSLNEIYISNGTKTDTTSILELFDINSKICAYEPLYPIYKDGSLCINRKVTILNNFDENFNPIIPKEKYDLIYMCSPNNPIGIAYSKDVLEKWVSYALKNKAIILYDNVYHRFITNKDVPKSIYDIKDAKKVAIEFRSFSKNASFTGVRCSYFIIPNDICKDINDLWKLRTINRFNGADYIAQKGAEATFLPKAKRLISKNIKYYQDNAKLLKKVFEKYQFVVMGGIDSPFLWIKNPNNLNSWETFEFFLKELNIIVIPGIIFGNKGDNYFRVSALGTRESVLKAIKRMENYYEKKF
ncbi:MAG: LL-diaminopimelate aminotransferase [Mollicutes bacterium]|nr:LL-diaminopimelate aminotransferase [Mollicutes bacterium]